MIDATQAKHIAIDGPAGSGKSSVARALAQALGLDHVDTGAMYRALTLVALREELDLADGEGLARRLSACAMSFEGSELILDGERVESELRGPKVTAAVSQVSAHADVRLGMVERQREICWDSPRGAVLEGRDIGTVVLPLARTKIFLDASARERARRRLEQQGEVVDEAALSSMEAEIERRDHLDSTREVSPLRQSPDAHGLDTTGLDLAAVVARCLELAEEPAPPAVGVPQSMHWFYTALGLKMRALMVIFFRFRRSGHQSVVVDGGTIFASNHISNFDPPLVGAAIPRQMGYLAKSELFRGPLGWLIRRFGAMPLQRGRWDGPGIDRARKFLAEGGAMLLFPEGTRRPAGRPGPVKRGLGLLSYQAGVPYVPVLIRGSERLGSIMAFQGRLEVFVGPKIHLWAAGAMVAAEGEKAFATRVGDLFLAQLQALEWLATRK